MNARLRSVSGSGRRGCCIRAADSPCPREEWHRRTREIELLITVSYTGLVDKKKRQEKVTEEEPNARTEHAKLNWSRQNGTTRNILDPSFWPENRILILLRILYRG